MTESPGLRVLVDGPGQSAPGFLRLGDDPGADASLRAGDDLPFTDRAVDAIVCGAPIAEASPSLRVPFLLECRRVLRPGGRLRLRASEGSTGEWRRLFRLVGFDDVAAAQPESPAAIDGRALLDAAKRDRRMRDEPLVSILIPAFNPRFFAASLDSAIGQSWRNLEIVIGDDSPGPEIEAIVHARRGVAIPIRYERNPVRLQSRGNSIRLFERAQGDFIKFLNDDDALDPRCVSTLLAAFRSDPDVTLATSCRTRIDEAGRTLPDQPATMPILPDTRVVAGHSLANTMIGAGLNVVGEPTTVLFRKDDLADQAPRYFRFDDIEGPGIIDMVTWAALLLRGDAVCFRERLSSFRIHAAQSQRAPGYGDRAVDSIRRLQAAWLPLGVYDSLPPDLLLTKSYPPPDDEEWGLERVHSFVPEPMAPEARMAAWRAERIASPR